MNGLFFRQLANSRFFQRLWEQRGPDSLFGRRIMAYFDRNGGRPDWMTGGMSTTGSNNPIPPRPNDAFGVGLDPKMGGNSPPPVGSRSVADQIISGARFRSGQPPSATSGSNNAPSSPDAAPRQPQRTNGPTGGPPPRQGAPFSNFGSPPPNAFPGPRPEEAPTNPTYQPPDPPTFKEGGLVGPGGMPVRPGMEIPPESQMQQLGASGQPQQLSMEQIEADAMRFVRQNPQEADKIKQVIDYAMSTGELTPQELNMFIQLARVALVNPSSWPQVRQFAIQQGMATEEDIPQEYDQGLLAVIYVISKVSGKEGGGDALQGQRPSGQAPSGPIPQNGPTGGIMAEVHEDEYVVPKEALMFHGKKKFDDMVGQARGGQQ